MMQRFCSLAFCVAIKIRTKLSTDTRPNFALLPIYASVVCASEGKKSAPEGIRSTHAEEAYPIYYDTESPM